MDETALSVEVEHDYLPEWNRMLPLPKRDDDDDDDEVDRRLARGARLRLWRSGPRKADELRPAVEAEVAEAVEAGEVADDKAAGRIDRVCLILASDTTIADPPNVEGVALELQRGRDLFARFYGPWRPGDSGPMSPVPYPDEYGNWPGEKWREAVKYSLDLAKSRRGWNEGRDENGRPCLVGLTMSEELAWHLLRKEKWDEAKGVAARELEERRERRDLAVATMPAVFEGAQQRVLVLLRGLHASGDLGDVPTDGNTVAEAALLRRVRAVGEIFGLSPAQQAEVADELMRVVATATAASDDLLIVPGLGYAIKVEGEKIVDVYPGNLTLTIEGRTHVLTSPELSRAVRLSARAFRDPRLCADEIYQQVLVDVDNPRGHWRQWWPTLAARLRRTSRVVEDAGRGMEWERFKAGVIAGAVESPTALPDGAPYRCSRGVFVGKEWLARKAVEAGVISESEKRTFLSWLGEARPEADDTGRRHKRLRIGGPPFIEGVFAADDKIAVRGTDGTNDA
jgi:hypothetical protein